MIDASMTKIGQVTVRNGQLLIADPYDIHDGELSREAVIHELHKHGGGHVGNIGGIADGRYQVFAEINEDGGIDRVTIDFQTEPKPELPVVTPEHFGALNLLAYHYDVLGGLLAEYSTAELDDLVRHGYRTDKNVKGTIK